MSGSEKPKSTWLTYLIEAAILLVGVLLALAIRQGIYETAIVISGSMEPTLLVGDRLLIDHRKSLHGHWRRGDIILFFPPESWTEDQDRYIKRVIGLPGETVDTGPNGVMINGQPLRENYINSPDADERYIRVTLGPGQYFVMGDNRPNSADSRKYGPISDGDIRGRATRRLTPLSRFGKLRVPTY